MAAVRFTFLMLIQVMGSVFSLAPSYADSIPEGLSQNHEIEMQISFMKPKQVSKIILESPHYLEHPGRHGEISIPAFDIEWKGERVGHFPGAWLNHEYNDGTKIKMKLPVALTEGELDPMKIKAWADQRVPKHEFMGTRAIIIPGTDENTMVKGDHQYDNWRKVAASLRLSGIFVASTLSTMKDPQASLWRNAVPMGLVGGGLSGGLQYYNKEYMRYISNVGLYEELVSRYAWRWIEIERGGMIEHILDSIESLSRVYSVDLSYVILTQFGVAVFGVRPMGGALKIIANVFITSFYGTMSQAPFDAALSNEMNRVKFAHPDKPRMVQALVGDLLLATNSVIVTTAKIMNLMGYDWAKGVFNFTIGASLLNFLVIDQAWEWAFRHDVKSVNEFFNPKRNNPDWFLNRGIRERETREKKLWRRGELGAPPAFNCQETLGLFADFVL